MNKQELCSICLLNDTCQHNFDYECQTAFNKQNKQMTKEEYIIAKEYFKSKREITYQKIDIKMFESYFDLQFKRGEELKENTPNVEFNIDEVLNLISNIYQSILKRMIIHS